MADRDLLNAFEDCIERLAAGQSLDDCLRRYPQYATALRPMLEAGRLVHRAGFSSSEVSEAQDRVRFRVAQRVKARRRPTSMPRIMPLVASLLVIFFFMTGAITILAENSIPGDTLYGVKLLTENVRLALVNNRGALQQQFEQRRLDETAQLLSANRAADVIFQGELQAINGTQWTVEGLFVEVVAETSGTDTVQVGDLIEIQASTTGQGELIARAIRRIRPNEVITSTPTVPTSTPTASPTTTPTFTPTATPSMTITPTPTSSLTPIPSATACIAGQPQGWVVYTIQAGDSLSRLAARTGTTLDEVMRVNCLTNRSLIVTGQQLFLPTVPVSTVTQAVPEVRPTAGEQDNSGRGENSGPGDGGDNSGEDQREGDNSGNDDDDSGRGGGDD